LPRLLLFSVVDSTEMPAADEYEWGGPIGKPGSSTALPLSSAIGAGRDVGETGEGLAEALANTMERLQGSFPYLSGTASAAPAPTVPPPSPPTLNAGPVTDASASIMPPSTMHEMGAPPIPEVGPVVLPPPPDVAPPAGAPPVGAPPLPNPGTVPQLVFMGQNMEQQLDGANVVVVEDCTKRRGKNPRWTPDEEANLRQLLQELGNSWAPIAERLGTGRTAAGVEQHWQVLTGRRKRKRAQTDANGMPIMISTSGADGELVTMPPTNSAGQVVLLGSQGLVGPSPKRRKAKGPRDPNKPKRPPSAFLLYSETRRLAVQDLHPELRGRHIQEKIGEEWRAMPSEVKAEWTHKYDELRAKYDVALRKYQAENPVPVQMPQGMVSGLDSLQPGPAVGNPQAMANTQAMSAALQMYQAGALVQGLHPSLGSLLPGALSGAAAIPSMSSIPPGYGVAPDANGRPCLVPVSIPADGVGILPMPIPGLHGTMQHHLAASIPDAAVTIPSTAPLPITAPLPSTAPLLEGLGESDSMKLPPGLMKQDLFQKVVEPPRSALSLSQSVPPVEMAMPGEVFQKV